MSKLKNYLANNHWASWLERHFEFLLKPTCEIRMTTYYSYCEWKGRLTGIYYIQLPDGSYVPGRFKQKKPR